MHLPVLGSLSFVSVSIVENVKTGADDNVAFSCCSCEEFSRTGQEAIDDRPEYPVKVNPSSSFGTGFVIVFEIGCCCLILLLWSSVKQPPSDERSDCVVFSTWVDGDTWVDEVTYEALCWGRDN